MEEKHDTFVIAVGIGILILILLAVGLYIYGRSMVALGVRMQMMSTQATGNGGAAELAKLAANPSATDQPTPSTKPELAAPEPPTANK